jgi:hypothetical protein
MAWGPAIPNVIGSGNPIPLPVKPKPEQGFARNRNVKKYIQFQVRRTGIVFGQIYFAFLVLKTLNMKIQLFS